MATCIYKVRCHDIEYKGDPKDYGPEEADIIVNFEVPEDEGENVLFELGCLEDAISDALERETGCRVVDFDYDIYDVLPPDAEK